MAKILVRAYLSTHVNIEVDSENFPDDDAIKAYISDNIAQYITLQQIYDHVTNDVEEINIIR